MTAIISLLPPNSTEFERRVETACRFDESGSAIDRITGVKHDMPPGFPPWLAAEWFLAEFAPYFDDTAELIAAGLPWLRMRGTESAVLLALSWIGYSATLEEDGARLHLDPGTPDAPPRLPDIKLLTGRSIPAHVLFYRLYHGYDIRHLRLDRSRLDDALLDDDSGVDVSNVVLSFGTHHTVTVATADQPISAGLMPIYSTLLWDDDSWRLDAWRLDSEVHIDAAGRVISVVSQLLAEPAAEAAVLIRYDVIPALVPDDIADLAIIFTRHDDARATLPDTTHRSWAGPWARPWREPIPSRYTEEH